MNKRMSFYRWMIKKYLNTDTAGGDLAGDMKRDLEFPKRGGRNEIYQYLWYHDACQGCLDTFDRKWAEYVENNKYASTEYYDADKKELNNMAIEKGLLKVIKMYRKGELAKVLDKLSLITEAITRYEEDDEDDE